VTETHAFDFLKYFHCNFVCDQRKLSAIKRITRPCQRKHDMCNVMPNVVLKCHSLASQWNNGKETYEEPHVL